MKHRFTKEFLNSLTAPVKGRVYLHDDKEPGLQCCITSAGGISFYTRRRVNGQDIRMYIGRYPDISIEQARKKAQELKGLVASGKDPHREKMRARMQDMTMEQLFNEYIERHAKKTKKSWKYDEREIPKFLGIWFKRRISTITKDEIQRLIERIFDKNGLYQANRILERVRGMYNKAISWGWEGLNPAAGIKKYHEQSRDRFVQPFEMPYLIRSIKEDENTTARDFFLTLLYTGARKTNTLMMRWETIFWDLEYWQIPDTKNNEPVNVPLVPQLISILAERRKATNSYWVFPQDEDTEKHFINPKRAWRRILARATLYFWLDDPNVNIWVNNVLKDLKFESFEKQLKTVSKLAKENKKILQKDMTDIRIHDLRRTFGSYQALSGASLQVIGKSLGHRSQAATQVYARLNLDPIRSSILKATELMHPSS